MAYHDEMVVTVLYLERDGAEARERRFIPTAVMWDTVPGEPGRSRWVLHGLDVADNTFCDIPLSGIIRFAEHGGDDGGLHAEAARRE
jgi:hypothetical protein